MVAQDVDVAFLIEPGLDTEHHGHLPARHDAPDIGGGECELHFAAMRFERPPFFRPVWWPNIVGLVLDADTDWDEVAALLTKSYCVLAPKKLAALVDGVSE